MTDGSIQTTPEWPIVEQTRHQLRSKTSRRRVNIRSYTLRLDLLRLRMKWISVGSWNSQHYVLLRVHSEQVLRWFSRVYQKYCRLLFDTYFTSRLHSSAYMQSSYLRCCFCLYQSRCIFFEKNNTLCVVVCSGLLIFVLETANRTVSRAKHMWVSLRNIAYIHMFKHIFEAHGTSGKA